MKTYAYTGYDAAGRSMRGMVEADTRKEAREQLVEQGVWVDSLQEASAPPAGRGVPWRSAFPNEHRAVFYRELGSLLQAGVALVPALDLVIAAPETGSARTRLAGVRDRVREGDALSRALSEAIPRLPAFETAVLRAGETVGTMDRLLHQLADVLDEQQRVTDRIGTALVYPLVVAGLALAIALVVVGLLLPSLQDMLRDTAPALPWPTRVLLAAGDWGLPGIGGLLLLAGGGGWLAVRRIRRSAAGAERLDRLSVRVPVVGSLRRTLIRLRFARTLSLLLNGGVEVVEAVTLAAEATGSPWVRRLAPASAEAIRRGDSIASAVSRMPPLGSALPGWIRAGEASGQLPRLLDRAADQFQRRWDRRVDRALALLEPALILAVGAAVLFLALAVLLPILSLNETLGG